MSRSISLPDKTLVTLYAALSGVLLGRRKLTKLETEAMLSFQGKLLTAGGKLLTSGTGGVVIPPVPVTLAQPVFVPASVTIAADAAPGTLLATLPAVQSGATRGALSPGDGRVRYRAGTGQTIVEVGATALSAASLSISVVDTLAGAVGSPRTATLPVTITAVVVTPPDSTARTAAKVSDYPVMGFAAPVGSVASLGAPLAMGDLRDSEMLELRRGGVATPAQFDVVDNPAADGSRRFSAVSVPLPAVIANGAVETWELWRKPKVPAPAALDFASKLAAHTCTLRFSNGANSATLNVLDPAVYASAETWFSGPYAVQKRLKLPINTAAVGGAADPEAWIDVTAYSDGTLNVDVSIHNDLCYMPRAQSAIAYRLEMTANGQKLMDYNVTLHQHKKRFRRERRFNTAGQVVLPPATLRPDLSYWSKTGFASHYDRPLGVLPAILTEHADRMANVLWETPFEPRGLKTQMTGPGGDPGIGELPRSGVMALMYGDRETLRYAMGQSEAYDGMPIHFMDSQKGGHVTFVERPWSRCNRDYLEPIDQLYPAPDATDWQPDEAHWANAHLVPYLLTGRRSCLDGLGSMAAYFLTKTASADFERGDFGRKVTRDETEAGALARINYWRNVGAVGFWLNVNQVRGYAWGLQRVQEAAALMPAAQQPRGPFFDLALIANARHQAELRPVVNPAQGSVLYGWPAHTSYGTDQHGAPWQFMFLVHCLIKQCYLDQPGAREMFAHAMHCLTRLALDSVGRNGEFYSGLNVGAYNLKILQVGYAEADWTNPAHMSREPMQFIDTDAGKHYFSATGDADVPDGGNEAADYHGRWIALLCEAYDMATALGLDTTTIKWCMASAGRWIKPKYNLNNVNFQGNDNGIQLSITLRGTSRVNGIAGATVAPGATLPPTYPLAFEEPLPALAAPAPAPSSSA